MSRDNWSPKVARALHEYHDAAPMPPSAEQLERHQPPNPSRHVGVTIAAAVLVVAMVVGLVVLTGRDASGPSGGGGAIEVHHHQYRVSIDGTLDCDTPIADATPFREVLVDMWSDRTGRQWRHRITYPDGTTFDVVMRGSIIYPTALFERGTVVQSSIGCIGPDGTLMPMAQIADPYDAITLAPEVTADELPYVQLYDQQGTLIDQHATDSQARATHLWEQRTTGSAGFGAEATLNVAQTTSWWIDAADDTTVTQRQFVNSIESLGTAITTDTLLVNETVQASPSLFDTTGYRSVATTPRPPPPPGEPATTVKGGTPVTTGTAPTDTSIAPPFTTDPTTGNCVGADLDLSKEPPLWRQPNNADWFRNGCLVRIDVITDHPGPDHCGWGTARVIVVGDPIGAPFTNVNDQVQYVRDPADAFQAGLDAGYDPNASLPPNAVDTGYRTDTEALWTVPGDDRYIYLVLDGRAERWPKGDPPLCS